MCKNNRNNILLFRAFYIMLLYCCHNVLGNVTFESQKIIYRLDENIFQRFIGIICTLCFCRIYGNTDE